MECNNSILGTSPADQENFKIFNGTEDELNDFIAMISPWCLICVMAYADNGEAEDHILSFLRGNKWVVTI